MVHKTNHILSKHKPDFGFAPPDVGPAFLILGPEDVEGGLWVTSRFAPFILLPLAILQTFRLDHPRQSYFSYDNSFPLVVSA
jgi:hypothetical protein